MKKVLLLGLSLMASSVEAVDLIGLHYDKNKTLIESSLKDRKHLIKLDANGNVTDIMDFGAKQAATLGRPVHEVPMPKSRKGQDALDHINVDDVASKHGLDSEKLKHILLHDETSNIDENNRLLYSEPKADTSKMAVSRDMPIAQTIDSTQAFNLHSNLGASKTIYLNFVGYTATGTAWSPSTPLVANPFDTDGNPSTFSAAELSSILSIWSRVSEDYIPFDVDVTTQAPTSDALIKTSASDNTYGTAIVITSSNVITCGCGGISYVGMISYLNNTIYTPAWVFNNSLSNNEKYIAESASHEAGHTLGLTHDGTLINGTTTVYYYGHGSGITGWAPIMGAGYYENVSQWSIGDYPNANNQQDDIASITSFGFGIKNDLVGSSIGTAGLLKNNSTTSAANIFTYGEINSNTDVDMYLINASAGPLSLFVNPAPIGPNLDVALSLYDVSGNVVASNAPDNDISASISTTLTTGTYYLAVSGSGRPASSSTDYGYSKYGSMGQYTITGTYTVSTNTGTIPTASIVGSTSVTAGNALTLTANASSSAVITYYSWTFGDGTTALGANVSHTYVNVGTYPVTLTVTNQYLQTTTINTTINVVAPALTSHVKSITITPTKVATSLTASSKIAVVDSNGNALNGAVVSASWSGNYAKAVTATVTGGYASFTTSLIPLGTAGTGSLTLTVTNITLSGYPYNSVANVSSSANYKW